MAEFGVLTVTQIMDLLRMNLLQLFRDAVYRLVAIGKLPGRKVGCTWRFPKNEIEQSVRGRHPETKAVGEAAKQ